MKRASIAFCFCAFISSTSHAAPTTWRYTGTIYDVGRNTINFPVPMGDPVSVEFTFESLTPDSNTHPQVGDFLLSGGDNNLEVKIGDSTNNPLDKYRIFTVESNCCASQGMFNLRSFDRQDLPIRLSFPGALGEIYMLFNLRERWYPIVTEALPLIQPDPGHYQEAFIWFSKFNSSGDRVLTFYASLDSFGPPIPEPNTALLFLPWLLTTTFVGRRESKDACQ